MIFARSFRAAFLVGLGLLVALLAFAPRASAAKQAVDFFGGLGTPGGQFVDPQGIAANDSGAGPANPGDIYVADSNNNRIQRFGRDDNGTPGNFSDDTYFFISAWGADVVSEGGTGDSGNQAAKNYEICTLAPECKAGVASGGNGTQAGNGTLDNPRSVAVDGDTGNVFVADRDNRRINAYDGAGNFLFSVGRDVAEPNGGTTVEVCEGATNTCRAGDTGSGLGEIDPGFGLGLGIAVSPADGNAATGTLFLADTGNQRVNTYALDGSSPASIGSAVDFVSEFPTAVAVDSRGILYANNSILSISGEADQRILRYDTTNANGGGVGFLAPLRASVSENQQLIRNATAGEYRLSFDPDGAGPQLAQTTGDLPYNASTTSIELALEALPSIGAGNLAFQSCNTCDPYIRFTGALSNTDLSQLVVSNGTTPLSGTISVSTLINGYGGGGANEIQDVTVAATAGTFTLSFDPDGGGPKPPETTEALPYNAPTSIGGGPGTIAGALRALPSIGNTGTALGGGPGNAGGTNPYRITFRGSLGATDVAQLTVDGSGLSGGPGASVSTVVQGQPGLIPGFIWALAVDPDSDGGGSDADVLYSATQGAIQQFGLLNAPGLTAPPSEEDDRHGTGPAFDFLNGLAAEPATGRFYGVAGSGVTGTGVYVLDDVNPTLPTGSLDSCDAITAAGFTCHGTVNPNGQPVTSYHFEYSEDGSKWTSTPTIVLGAQETPQAIDERIEPAGAGLKPNTPYHVRLVYQRRFAVEQFTTELTPATLAAPPLVETDGSPVRTASTATLLGRVLPNGLATTYRFQYGSQGPCDANPCSEATSVAAGSGHELKFASEKVVGLEANTTYHYRIVADNGVGDVANGADRTFTTRASDKPLSHGNFPGPPGSDRAYELVSLPDSNGNPIGFLGAKAFSADANRAVYTIFGGTSISDSGSALSLYFAERPPGAHPTTGWQAKSITPPRDQLAGPNWAPTLQGSDDLSSLVGINAQAVAPAGSNEATLWRLSPQGAPGTLFELQSPTEFGGLNGAGTNASVLGTSADASRVIEGLQFGSLDPAFPAAAAAVSNLYNIGSGGAPQLVSLLPSGQPPACGVARVPGVFASEGAQAADWVSEDGSRVFFPSRGDDCTSAAQLYVRDIPAAQTKPVSGAPISGPACDAALIRATPEAVFFATQSRLDPEDVEPSGCPISRVPDNDVYRYEFATEELDCLTCVVADLPADVRGTSLYQFALAEDGSRLYFVSEARLTPGAPPQGENAIYRLDVASGELAYVAPGSGIGTIGEGVGLSSDGRFLLFRSNEASLNPLGGGTDNGATQQYYLYDDEDRSLVCASCPPDGSEPLADASIELVFGDPGTPGINSLADDGTVAFLTKTPLVGADQNTPGTGGNLNSGADIYEFRDGRPMLVTDGLINWPASDAGTPHALAISRSGRDIFFYAAARYTPDAIDGVGRLYTARIGGGIDFPPKPKPCPLEVCQGTPKGAPEEQGAASANFAGAGNKAQGTTARRCPKGKRRVNRGGKARCVKRQPKHSQRRNRANHNWRNAR